ICAPLKAKDRVLGAIAIGTQTSETYTAEHLRLVSIFASQTAVAIEKALLYEQSCQAAIEAKAQAEQLQQALQELRLAQTQLIQSEKMSSLGQLIAGVAHEINNPVNFICGNLKYVAEYTHDLLRLLQTYQTQIPVIPPELAAEMDAIDLDFLMDDLPKILNSMKLGTNRIVEIVQSLKNFSRHDEAEMKQVNIHDGIDGTLMILRHRLKAVGTRPAIDVIKDYADLPLIECYAGQLNQVFMNILANALDALEESLVLNPTITIRTQHCDHSVVVCIADNGMGMSEDTMRRLYDPFFTTKEIGKGTGLGMAISHQIIVDKHQGILKCRSQPGKGTEFWIQIPMTCSTAIASNDQIRPALATEMTEMIASPTLPEATSTADADGFVSSTSSMLEPTDLLIRHRQLIQRLSAQNTDVVSNPTEQMYRLFQHYPIALRLYTLLLSQVCCSVPVHRSH
ncbi:MAG TPA: ATP-binding protein, partial [Crinalium sp.]